MHSVTFIITHHFENGMRRVGTFNENIAFSMYEEYGILEIVHINEALKNCMFRRKSQHVFKG